MRRLQDSLQKLSRFEVKLEDKQTIELTEPSSCDKTTDAETVEKITKHSKKDPLRSNFSDRVIGESPEVLGIEF